ncbi:MAG: hypothetical protein ACNA7L_12395 [Roseinatronobacter sp.]
MLTLDLTHEPRWLEIIPGLRLKLRPLTTAVMVSARANSDLAQLGADPSQEELALVMARAVAREAILAWDGVGDAEGQPIAVSPEGIDALLEIWPVFEAFQTRYIGKHLLLDAEKNASAPLPNGSSAGAIATARPVRSAARTARRSKTAP